MNNADIIVSHSILITYLRTLIIPAIVNQLLSQYAVQAEEAESEVNAFIDMLTGNGLAER